jgi:hypothetical protein
MFIYILIALAVILIVFISMVASRPADFRIARSTRISALPQAAFAHVNDLHKFQVWSPWAKLDPSVKKTYDGSAFGAGASCTWAGNKKVGEGTMTITENRPSQFIGMKLEFRKPFKATNTAEFTFTPQNNQTNVEWAMMGRNNFFMKAFGLFMNMDKMIGNDFEKGLANLKSVAEASSRI